MKTKNKNKEKNNTEKEKKINQINQTHEKNLNVIKNGYLKEIILPENTIIILDKFIDFINYIILKNKYIDTLGDDKILLELYNKFTDKDEYAFIKNSLFKKRNNLSLLNFLNELYNSIFIEDYLEVLPVKNDIFTKINSLVDENKDYILDFYKTNRSAYLSIKTLLYAIALNKNIYPYRNNIQLNMYYRINKIYSLNLKDKTIYENKLVILIPKKIKEIINYNY